MKKRLMSSRWIDGSMVTGSGVACVATGKQTPKLTARRS